MLRVRAPRQVCYPQAPCSPASSPTSANSCAREGGRFAIRCGYPAESIAIGASIACDGACLTATSVRPRAPAASFTVDVSNETLSRTTLGDWQPGRRINLERALKAGDELGGHIVSGHVDGVGRIVDRAPTGLAALHGRGAGASWPATLRPRARWRSTASRSPSTRWMAKRFGINIIPHTLTHTTLGRKKPGDRVNLEVDVFARYVARAMEFRP